MDSIEKRVWLAHYLIKKLDLIKEEPATGFSNNEKFFIKGLNILYKIDGKFADYFADQYKVITNTKASIITSKIYSGEGSI